MNLPVEPVNPVHVLIQLLSFLNESSGSSYGAGAKGVPASLKEASKLLFVPPAGKISFDSGLKIVPILHSFQQKLERAADTVKIPPTTRSTSPQPKDRGTTPENPKPLENVSVKKLVEEVKQALRIAPQVSPREMPLVKAVAERLIPLLDRLAASTQLPSYQGKSKTLLNPPKPEAKDLGEAPKRPVEREQAPEKQQQNHALRRESVQQINRQIRETNRGDSAKPETSSRASDPQPTSTKTALPHDAKPHFRTIAPLVAPLVAPRAAAGEAAPSRPVSSETQTIPFAVPFFAQASISNSFSSKRKRDKEEEEKDQREEEEKEGD